MDTPGTGHVVDISRRKKKRAKMPGVRCDFQQMSRTRGTAQIRI